MPAKVIMPQLGESVYECTLTRWLKEPGARVAREEPLFEVSTDKVDSEIPSPAEGILEQILVQEGETVKVGSLVAILADPEVDAIAPAPSELSPAENPPAPDTEPESSLSSQAADREGATPPVESLSAAVEAEPPEQVLVPAASDEAPSPDPTPGVEALAGEEDLEVDRALPEREALSPPRRPGSIRTSPLVRRLAREHGVDLAEVMGTGLSGRITRKDFFAYLEHRSGRSTPQASEEAPPAEKGDVEAEIETTTPSEPLEAATQEPPAPEAAPAKVVPDTSEESADPSLQFSGEIEVVSMTPMRKAIAKHMVASRRTSAHVQTVFEVDMTSIARRRESQKEVFEIREGFKLTYTPFLVKALVDTVREFPILNCSVSGDTIIFKRSINVGIAVALESGLIVPVIREAGQKTFAELARDIHDLAGRARSKKLLPEEVQQGTITITNPGGYGSLFGTPIINQPQVAILGVGTLEKRPVIIEDAIAIRTMAYLVLSFDHRVIDGAVADQSMAALKRRLQGWSEELV